MIFRLAFLVPLLMFAESQASTLPFPTKDEVLTVNGQALSIDRFLSLRTWLGTPSTESVLWVAKATLALHSELMLKQKIRIAFKDAAILARYAIGHDQYRREAEQIWRQTALLFGTSVLLPEPNQVRRELDLLISRSVIQQNTQVLAELR